MSESNPWADQWLKAQQQFVGAWSDMAKSSNAGGNASQSDLWSQSFELWRQACQAQTQPDIQQAMQKCVDMGKEYFAMAEQISKGMTNGANPVEAVNQWMEQIKQSMQQFSGVPGFDSAAFGDFMKQWFNPTQSWQQMADAFTPMNQAAWQLPGMNTSVFNMGEAIDPMGKILSSPGVGYFREPQEKQQKGIQLGIEYHQANFEFNQAFLRVASESIQGFQARLLKIDGEATPKTLRQIYDLWVEISEEHYAEFAMSEEYQALYGNMVNRLMILKKHYSEITDDFLRAMNLPNTREVDTMQMRLQQLRRDNIELRNEIKNIRAMLKQPQSAPAAKATPVAKSARAAKPAPASKRAPAKTAPSRKKAVARKAPAKKPDAVVKKQAAVNKAKAGA